MAALAELIERVDTADRTPLLVAIGLGGLIAVSLALFPFVYVAAGFGAVLVIGLCFLNRLAVIFLLLPAVALSPEVPVLGIPIRAEDVLMVPLVAAWIFHLCVAKSRSSTALDRVMIAYLLVAVAATAWGAFLGTAHLTSTSKDTSAAFHLLKRFEFVLLFLIMVDTLTTPRYVYGVAAVLLVSLVALAFYGLTQYFANGLISAGPTGSPGHEPGLGSMLTVALGVTMLPALRGPARGLLAAAMVFSLVTLPLTLGRNYLTTTLFLFLYVAIFQRQRWILLLLPAAWVIGVALYPSYVIDRMLSLQGALALDPTGGATQGASLLSRIQPPSFYGLLALGHSPVLGFGMGSIPLGFPDSEFVTQLYYTGLVGFGIFLLMGTRLFRMVRDVVTGSKDATAAALARGCQLIFVAYAIHSIFSPSISADRAGWFFFFAAALLAVLHRSINAAGRADGSPRSADT